MYKRTLLTFFLIFCFILISVPAGFCISSPPTIYVAGDGSGDYNCAGKSDQVQINQALKFVSQNKGYTTVHLKGPFTYVIDDTILIGSNTILEGDPNAVLKLADRAGWPVMKPLIQQISNSGNENITVRGFEVNGNYAGNNEITLGRGYYNIMYFTNSNNIKVYNMYMHDGMGDGLRLNRGKNIQFFNNTIYKLGHDGLYAIGCENVEAWNNRITCRTNSGLRVWNSNDVKYHNNVIDSFYHWSAGGPGIQIEKSDGVMDNIEIYNNIIHNTYGPGIWMVTHDTTAVTESQAKNIHIHHNVFYNTGTNPSITWVGGIIASGFHDTLIENNVFDGCYGAAIAHMFTPDYVPKGGFRTIIRNNIIVNTQKRTKDSGGTGCGIANYLPETHFFVMDNDCLFNNTGSDYKNCASTTDIYVSPQVADLKNHNYRLLSTAGRWDGNKWVKDSVNSLCIDAGYLYSEYFNEPEPNGNRINIGPDGNTVYASKSNSIPLLEPLIEPIANFSSNKTSGYAPLSVQFFDSSENTITRVWDFGDRANSTQQNPSHTYSSAGSYIVTLTASNANGTNSKSTTITAYERPVLPVADFRTNATSGYAPLSVQFTDLSQYGESRSWDFNNDGAPDSVISNPVYTYSVPGVYTVNLVVRNSNGTNSKSATINVSLQPVLPIADFSSNVTQGYAPLSVQFVDLSKKSISWAWNFDDGTISSQQSPIHTYLTAGNYRVALIVNNENGTSSKIAAINVLDNNNSRPGSEKGNSSTGKNENIGNVNGTSSSEENSSVNFNFENNSISNNEESSTSNDINGGSGSSGSSSGGGGGAGGSPEPQTNVEAKELSQIFIRSGSSAKFEFPQQATPIASLSFDSKQTTGKTTTIVEELKGKSTLVPELPAGEVYKSLNIWVGNNGFGDSSNIVAAVVNFKVEKSWTRNKQIEKSSIFLNRYSKGNWDQLPTNLSGEDDLYLYYTARTPGFSPFAITGKIAAEKTETGSEAILDSPGLNQNVNNQNLTATNVFMSEQTKNKTASGKGFKNTPGFEAIILVVCLLAAFFKRA